jgi:hypothetical protein
MTGDPATTALAVDGSQWLLDAAPERVVKGSNRRYL